jgi:hypothetical protein
MPRRRRHVRGPASTPGRFPPIYRPPLGLPLAWQDETSGVLGAAVRAFVAHSAAQGPQPEAGQIELVRAISSALGAGVRRVRRPRALRISVGACGSCARRRRSPSGSLGALIWALTPCSNPEGAGVFSAVV